jgi:hypothetical protein
MLLRKIHVLVVFRLTVSIAVLLCTDRTGGHDVQITIDLPELARLSGTLVSPTNWMVEKKGKILVDAV